jgi:hypothetical protein
MGRSSKRSKDKDLLERIRSWIVEGTDYYGEIHDRAEENHLYVRGEQWEKGDIERQGERERPAMSLNKIILMVNAVANREILQRFQPICYGRTNDDHGWAEVNNGFLRWTRDVAETEHEVSSAFRALCVTGYGCMHKMWDPLAEQVVDEEVPIWEMLIDSRARRQNLTDRRWHLRGRWVPVSEAEEEYGSLSRETKRFFRALSNRDDDLAMGRSIAGGWSWGAVAAGRWYNVSESQVFLVEAEWRDVAVEYKAAIPRRFDEWEAFISGVTEEITIPELDSAGQAVGEVPIAREEFLVLDDELQRRVEDAVLFDTQVTVFDSHSELDAFSDRYSDIVGEDFEDWARQRRHVYKYAIVAEDVVLEQGERDVEWTYEFLTGFPTPTRDGTKFFSPVDVARAPQDWRNLFLSLALTRLQTSPKQTIIFEKGAVDDPDTFFDELANPRGAVAVNDGFISSNRYMMLNAPNFPPMEERLISMADQGVNEIAGLSGLDTGAQQDLRRISGRVVQSVREASNTMLAILFDSLRRYRKRDALLTLRFMQEFYTPEQVVRIVGEERAVDVPDPSVWPELRRFDLKVEETPVTVDERLEMFDFLTRTGILGDWVQQDLVPFEVVLDWLPQVSEADKRRIMQHREQKQADASQFEQLAQFLSQQPQGAELLNSYLSSQGGPN